MHPKNTSGSMLKKTQNKLKLIYFNNDEHMHMDRANGSTDIPEIGADLGSDHLPIEISIDTTPHRNISTNPINTNLSRLTKKNLKQHSMKC